MGMLQFQKPEADVVTSSDINAPEPRLQQRIPASLLLEPNLLLLPGITWLVLQNSLSLSGSPFLKKRSVADKKIEGEENTCCRDSTLYSLKDKEEAFSTLTLLVS